MVATSRVRPSHLASSGSKPAAESAGAGHTPGPISASRSPNFGQSRAGLWPALRISRARHGAGARLVFRTHPARPPQGAGQKATPAHAQFLLVWHRHSCLCPPLAASPGHRLESLCYTKAASLRRPAKLLITPTSLEWHRHSCLCPPSRSIPGAQARKPVPHEGGAPARNRSPKTERSRRPVSPTSASRSHRLRIWRTEPIFGSDPGFLSDIAYCVPASSSEWSPVV
jgi:hypothetical protein